MSITNQIHVLIQNYHSNIRMHGSYMLCRAKRTEGISLVNSLAWNMSLKECEELRLKNCSCKAYANLDIRNGGSGCLLWFADLVDLVVLQMGGQDLYIRVAALVLDHVEKNKHFGHKNQVIIIVCSAILLMVMLAAGLICMQDETKKGRKEDMELPIFDLTIISNATDNFASNKKLGEDQTKSKLLDWCMCHNIIGGIVRGLLYLHEDSRLRIIHRDLKVSNILLNNNMNPKISDFGLVIAFGGDQTEANANRIVGTYGYMPPEYAKYGHFLVKTYVFSFGVLVLEIVSRKKNKEFCNFGQCLNLLGYAWRLWIEDRPTELIDEFLILGDSCILFEVLRYIHVGLLCVQQRPEDRPNISSVVLMLSSGNSLPNPGQPGFYTEKAPLAEHYSSRKLEASSTNEITFTLLEAR
uniref:non-specific serine/threonine protein kinase n=1 Tax=Quercus lobata TaxID=97700 RepID=A0A7N2L1X5_QUELO